jgi:acetyltransferase
MGVMSTDPAVRLNATFSPIFPPAGNVSMLSQSGALGLAMLDYAKELHLGIADFVSIGNKADVSVNDLLAYWHSSPRTKVIALYLESFGNPRMFARLAPEVARDRPIVAVKSGRSAAGTRAASSHSAALASLDVGIDALFAQTGVIRTTTLEEMFDVVALLSSQPVPAGGRIGVSPTPAARASCSPTPARPTTSPCHRSPRPPRPPCAASCRTRPASSTRST